MDAQSARRAAGVTAALLLLAACGSGNTGEPTVQTSRDEGSANAPLMPSVTPGSTTATVKRGSVPIVPRTSAAARPPTASKPQALPPRLGGGKPLTAATGAPPPPPDNVNPCAARHLAIRAIRQRRDAALLVFTNTGASACALTGWPAVTLTRDGADTGVTSTRVNEPGPPVGMALSGGHSAFAGLRWKPCAPTANGCHTGGGLRVGSPGADPIQAKLVGFPGKRLSMSVLVIGSIQPTVTNIVDW